MGLCNTKEFEINSIYPGQNAKSLKKLFDLGLEKSEINCCYACFKRLDLLNEGTVDLDHFCDYFSIKENLRKLVEAIFVIVHSSLPPFEFNFEQVGPE